MPSSDVIWQCKDYADGWISFPSEREAATYQAATGCAVRTVPHPTPTAADTPDCDCISQETCNCVDRTAYGKKHAAAADTGLVERLTAEPSQIAQYVADCREFAEDQMRGRFTEMPASYWDKMAADWQASAQREAAARAERDEAVAERKRMWANCKDLSKQGWSALSDARQWLFVGQPADIEEAKQCIDLAQASFADTIIASERRAEAAEQREAAAREQIAALEREKTKVNDEWVKEFTAQCLAAHGTTVDVIMPRMEAAEAELAAAREQIAALERERDGAWNVARKLADFEKLFRDCQEARDSAGFVGSVPECIQYFEAALSSAQETISRMTEGPVFRVTLDRGEEEDRITFTFINKAEFDQFMAQHKNGANGWVVTDILEYACSTADRAALTLARETQA